MLNKIFENLVQKVYDVKSQEFTEENYAERKKRLVYSDPRKDPSQPKEESC